MEVDQAHVYFTRALEPACTPKGCYSDIELHRIPRCGGASELVAPANARVNGVPMVTPRGDVAYWTAGGALGSAGNDLVRLHVAGGSTTTISTTASCLTRLLAGDSFLFAHDRCLSAIVRTGHSDPALAPLVEGVLPAKRPFTPLAATATRVYYADPEGVSWASLDGRDRGRAYRTSLGIAALAADDNALFVTEGELFGGFNLARVPHDGSPTQIVAPLQAVTQQTVVSYGTVYFATPLAVQAAPADGTGAPRQVVEGPTNDFDVQALGFTGYEPSIPATRT